MTRSAEQTTSAVWRGAVRGGIDSISRAAINWKSWVLLATSLALIVLSCLAFDSATLRDWLPVVLLAMAAGIVVASLVLSRFCMERCVSCGSSPTDLVWRLDDCPVCHGSYCGAADLLAGNSVLSLQDCLSGRRAPLVTSFGVVLALALRDRASRIRLVGGKVYDQAECPWTTPCGSWSIWITVDGTDYEMLPPPRRLATSMFELLRETYRKLEKETPNGPARLPLALDDWSETVQLVIEESDKDRAASILFPPGPREPVGTAGSRLRQLFFHPGDDRGADPTPPATTWKRLPLMNDEAVSIWRHQVFEEVPVRRGDWQAGLIALTCLLLIVFGVAGLVSPGFRAGLPHVLLVLMICLLVAPSILDRFYRHRCASCGSTLMEVACSLHECPDCHGLFRSVAVALPRNKVLRLNNILDSTDPIANALGMTIALGMRDAAAELRIAGRKLGGNPDNPWDATCSGWRMWLTQEESSYELVPPPRQLGSGMFLILREIYRTSSKDNADARARFRIEVDDCAADAEVLIEEDEKEIVARVIFESEKPRQPWSAPRAYFEKALSRVAGSDIFDPTPRETTWRRFPRFLPMWALAGISLIALAAGIVGTVSLVVSPFNPAGAFVVGFFVLAASTLLLKAHRRCSHCGTALCQWPETAFFLWCPECRSLFDPSQRSLPTDGSTLRLDELAKRGDPHEYKLGGLLDYALNCRYEKAEFSTVERSVVVHLVKGDVRTRIPRAGSYDGPLCLQLLAELDRRFGKKSGDDVATFSIVGWLYQATATLRLEEVDGGRRAVIRFQYPEAALTDSHDRPGC